MLLSFILELILLVLYTVFGMAMIPDILKRDKNGNLDEATVLIAPAVGMAAWMAVSIFLGFFVPYNKTLLIILLIIAAGIVIYRRKSLFLPKDLHIGIFVLVSILASLLILWDVIPREINGGLYFTPSAFDHQRTAMINSIAATGLPPVNPYLAVNGKTGQLFYHFGFQALAAQSRMILGVSGLTAGAACNALVLVISFMTAAFLAYKFSGKKAALIFVFLFLVTGSAGPFLMDILPQSVHNQVFYNNFIGWWSSINDTIWTPHNILAASLTILIIWIYPVYLKTENKKDTVQLSVLLAMLAAAAALSSIYAGAFALALFVLAIAVEFVLCAEFRHDFMRILPYQLLCAALVVLLCFKYGMHLAQSQNPDVFSIGILPAYKVSGIGDAIKAILNFYLAVLPVNIGVVFLLGIIAVFVRDIITDKRRLDLVRIYTVITWLAVFFIYDDTSMGEYNFGWRTPTAARFYLIIFSAVLAVKIYEKLKESGKEKCRYAVLFIALLIPLIFYQDIKQQSTVYDTGTEAHTILAKARKGWEVIRENTDYSDIVTCNPAGFLNLGNDPSDEAPLPVNFLFGYYADRPNCIADNYYTKTSCVGGITHEEVDSLYNRMIDFFAGNPGLEEVNFLADEWKVKALLVTPVDGLWDRSGELEKRYTRKIEGDQYRAYFLTE